MFNTTDRPLFVPTKSCLLPPWLVLGILTGACAGLLLYSVAGRRCPGQHRLVGALVGAATLKTLLSFCTLALCRRTNHSSAPAAAAAAAARAAASSTVAKAHRPRTPSPLPASPSTQDSSAPDAACEELRECWADLDARAPAMMAHPLRPASTELGLVESCANLAALLAGGGRGARYVSASRRVRVYVKVPGAEPEDMPDDLASRLAEAPDIGGLHLVNVCMRRGCIELLVELAGQQRQGAPAAACGGQGESAALAAAILSALGVNLPAGTQVVVNCGEQQLLMEWRDGSWRSAVAVAVAVAVAAAADTESAVSEHQPAEAAAAALAGPSARQPPRRLTLHPSHLSTHPHSSNRSGGSGGGGSGGAGSNSGGDASLTLYCQLSHSLQPGEALVVTQTGRFLVSQLLPDSGTGGTGGTTHQLLVWGCDWTAPGLLRVELRQADGRAVGTAGVLLLHSAAVAREVDDLRAQTGWAATPPGKACEHLQDVVADLGAWLEFVAATSQAAASDGASGGSGARDSGCCVAGVDGSGGGGGSAGRANVLDLRKELRTLAVRPAHRQLMVDVAGDLLAFCVRQGWACTAGHIREGLRAVGADPPADLPAMQRYGTAPIGAHEGRAPASSAATAAASAAASAAATASSAVAAAAAPAAFDSAMASGHGQGKALRRPHGGQASTCGGAEGRGLGLDAVGVRRTRRERVGAWRPRPDAAAPGGTPVPACEDATPERRYTNKARLLGALAAMADQVHMCWGVPKYLAEAAATATLLLAGGPHSGCLLYLTQAQRNVLRHALMGATLFSGSSSKAVAAALQ